jgi:hypothetical protein
VLTILWMSDLRARLGPARVGDESAERECDVWSAWSARWGIRDRGRPVGRGVVSSVVPLAPLDGLPENETSGEKGGDEGSAGEDSWIGEMGRLRGKGGGVVEDMTGEERLEEAGDIDGEDGPGDAPSVRTTDVAADGPYELRLGASSTSFNSDDKKLGPPELSPFSRALALAALDDSPVWFCWASAASSCGRLVRGRFNLR